MGNQKDNKEETRAKHPNNSNGYEIGCIFAVLFRSDQKKKTSRSAKIMMDGAATIFECNNWLARGRLVKGNKKINKYQRISLVF